MVIRALSDTASETATDDFAANLDKVCANSFRLLENLIPAIGPGATDPVAAAKADPDIQKAS